MYAFIINIMGSLSYWYGTVLKEILKNNFGVQFEYEITDAISDFYNYFVVGEILSGFLWTYLLKYMSTRVCILVSLAMQSVVYIVQTQLTSLNAIFFCRVVQGFFNNVNSLGKSYVFEFCDVDLIKLAFSTKGFIAIVLSNFFPQIGNWVYDKLGKDYQSCCWVWFAFNTFFTVAFFVIFFVWKYSDNTQDAVNRRNKLLKDQEAKANGEVKEVAKEKKNQKEESYGLVRVAKHILSDKNTLLLFLVYILTKSIHKAIQAYKLIIFLKDENLGGLDFDKDELGIYHTICILPSFIIIFAQPRLVPKVFSYKAFIGGCITLFLLFIFLIPGLADIARVTGTTKEGYMRTIMKINYMMMNLFTAKLFTPAMNILLNLYIEKQMRAGLNSIFYLGVSFTVLILNQANKKMMNYFFDDLVAPPTEFVKYQALSIFLLLQGFALLAILLTDAKKQG